MMELPISPQSYQPTTDALVRAVKRSRLILGRAMGEETSLAGGTTIANARRPFVRSANFACELNLLDGQDATQTLDEIKTLFEDANCPCHVLDSAALDWPESLVTHAQSRGYQPIDKRVMQLQNHQPTQADDAVQVVPARAVYGQLAEFYKAMAMADHHADAEQAKQFADAMADRLDEPRLDMFVARKDNQVVAAAGVVSLGQMGVIDPAYTLPAYRGQGLAGVLLQHVLDHCQRALFEQVLLERSATCPSVGFYQSRGFEQVAQYHRLRLENQT